MAALLPGLMAVALFLLTIAVYVAIWPSAGPRGGTGDRAEFVAASLGVIPVLVIFLLVIGGMYAGFYNPTPAAAVGAFLVWGYGALRRGMRWAALRDSLLETAKTSGLHYLLLTGAELLTIFMTRPGVPQAHAPSQLCTRRKGNG